MSFFISTKIQDGGRNSDMLKFFRGHSGAYLGTQWVQNLLKISYGFQDKHFPFPPKFKTAAKIWKSLNSLEVLEEYSLVPWDYKIDPKSLYLLQFF